MRRAVPAHSSYYMFLILQYMCPLLILLYTATPADARWLRISQVIDDQHAFVTGSKASSKDSSNASSQARK